MTRLDTYSPGGEFRLYTNKNRSVLAYVFTATKIVPDGINLQEVEFVVRQPDLIQKAEMLSFVVLEPEYKAANIVGWDWTENILKYAAHDEQDEDKLIIPVSKLKGDAEFTDTFKKGE